MKKEYDAIQSIILCKNSGLPVSFYIRKSKEYVAYWYIITHMYLQIQVF